MKNSDPRVLEVLDLAWDDERGVLGKLRAGVYDPGSAADYLAFISEIEIEEGERLHADFVRLLWFAPLFSEWQIERAVERGASENEVTSFANKLRERVMEILGVP